MPEIEAAMPRRKRPPTTCRSEHWLRVAVNDASAFTNEKIGKAFGWHHREAIEWKSPVKSDQYAEYYDHAFVEKLGIDQLSIPLDAFWPPSGPRWDGLARTSSGKLLLVEAKAYIEECVDFGSKAGAASREKIRQALEQSKLAYGANTDANWETPFYQYANRLAHLHFLVSENSVDAYLVFIYFANAPDVPSPCTSEQWEGAKRLTQKCLGLSRHACSDRISTVIIDVPEMCRSFSPKVHR